MTVTATESLSLADQVWARLKDTTGVVAYDGEIVDADGTPTDPPADPDGRVAAHAVFYPSPGFREARMLDANPDTLNWSFQVSCVGGDRTRCLWCADQVRKRLDGLELTDDHGQTVRIREVGDPGPILRDDDVTPSRTMTPLRYAATA